MKNAYSNLLGEYVDAKDVVHADTAPFQIVCPCCAESIFKVVRPTNDRETHFFSHRQADKAFVAECERRVGSIPSSEMESRNLVGRGQSLKLFCSVLREAIDLDYGHEGSPSFWHGQIQRAPSYAVMQDFFLRPQKDAASAGWQEAACDEFLASLEGEGLRLEDGLSRHFQQRVSLDVMRTLLTPQQSRSYGYLFRHALSRLATFHTLDSTDGEYDGYALTQWLLSSAGQRSSISAEQSLVALDARRTGHSSGETEGALVRRLVGIEMMGTLMRLPYKEILANHRAGKPLLFGLDRIDRTQFGLGLADGP